MGGVLGVMGSLHNRSSGSGCLTSDSTLRSKEPNWAGGGFNDYGRTNWLVGNFS